MRYDMSGTGHTCALPCPARDPRRALAYKE
jgi:hypothetical protein